MNIEDLKAAQDKLAETEKATLQDIEAKAELLGFALVRKGTIPTPKTRESAPKRKRRTKAEMEAARSTPSEVPHEPA